MIPNSVLIQYDRCRLELNLPIFFEASPITNIRKVFKLLEGRPYQNENALVTLDQFFPAWEQTIIDNLEFAKNGLTAAKRDVEEKHRAITVLGTMLNANIEQAKRWLAHARKRPKKPPEVINEYKEALKQVMRPKTEYEQAIKNVKRMESSIKTAKAALERSGKIINAYKELKVN